VFLHHGVGTIAYGGRSSKFLVPFFDHEVWAVAIHRLDRDFFLFLDTISKGAKPWPLYRSLYLYPHREFLEAYWKSFQYYDEETIRKRVEQVRIEHYGQIRSIFERKEIMEIVRRTLDRWMEVLPRGEEPDVYLFVGFFSSDGFCISFNGRHVIGIGCERFRSMDDLPLLIAHEYGHLSLKKDLEDCHSERSKGPKKRLISEGIAVNFTREVFPRLPLCKHLFLKPERLQWCIEHEEELILLWENGLSQELFFLGDPGSGIPPRVGYFLAYRIVEGIRRNLWPERPIAEWIRAIELTEGL